MLLNSVMHKTFYKDILYLYKLIIAIVLFVDMTVAG